MSNALIPVSDVERMAAAVARSNLFGVKSVEQAMALMLIAQAEGMHPAIAARDYHVIQGRPALKADAMLARFQQAGGKVQWRTYTDQEVSATFSHPQGGSVDVSWTIGMAAAAKLTGKDTWKQYPRQMLRARVISEGIRTVFPGVAVGVYTVEETEDFTSKPTTRQAEPRDMGPVEVVKPAPAGDLMDRACAAADQGMAAYSAFWKGISKADRVALADEHETLKVRAQEADAAAVVDATSAEAE